MAIPFTSIAFSFFQGALPCLSQIASQYSCGLNDVDIMILYVQNQTTEVFLGCACRKVTFYVKETLRIVSIT